MNANGLMFYALTLLVYGGVDILASLGLSFQFGTSGVINLGFITFQAVGAYVAAVLSLPDSSANGGFQQYIGGWNLAFPLPWIGATIAGGLLSLPFTYLVGRRLRGDFAATGLLITAVMANMLVTNFRPLFNGAAGLSLVPAPLDNTLDPASPGYQWMYAALTLLIAALTYVLLRRLTNSPYGRSLRAMRDNDVVADSLGKNLVSQRRSALVVGGAIAGLSGGILVGFINLWAPASWSFGEGIVLFAAVIIGGAGNHKGAILGAILVPVVFLEGTRFLPPFGPPSLIPSLQWVSIGLLLVLFLWFRPQGVLPERRMSNPTFPDAAAPRALATDTDAWTLPGAGSAALMTVVARQAPAGLQNAGSVRAEPILRVRELTKNFDGVPVVKQVSFDLQAGKMTGLIGPNGAGKSTTLAMIAGTLPITSGQVILKGRDITATPSYQRAQQGLVRTFQLASEFKRLTVLENLLSAAAHQDGDSLVGALRGRRFWGPQEDANIDRARAVLERFGLTRYANQYAGDLSGGQRRMVEIMRALMAEPELLLLDEPLAGVHPHLSREIASHLLNLTQEGMSIMIVEHELSIMDEFCEPVVVMADGAVLAQGTMAELRAQDEVIEAYLVG